MEIDQKDEIGILASALNEMVDKLKSVLTEVRGTADIGAGTGRIKALPTPAVLIGPSDIHAHRGSGSSDDAFERF
ncbi:hypothetical protein SIID45300_00451 [Candidatus Magnetaquicoccaceae bacterium FCR-1]|uniref:HAMP domain-containing protein n=1 Tax=Candidatus Magnetaquiglobus chichijimensis TaxID=3141448 RepID=A0ABQ0C5I2_9PROT